MLSVLLAGSMVVGSTSMLTGCGTKKKNGVIKLDVYSQLANTQGMQTGWGADVLKEKFNVELNIIPDADGVYQTRAQNGNLGDIVIWGSDSKDYVDAVQNDLLLDWNEDDLLTDCGPYIKKHMADALKKTVVLQRLSRTVQKILHTVLLTALQQTVRTMMHSSIHGILVGTYIRS